jgi:UDP-glucose:(heptosyl)LPS alpha-1,3-glucosyltransferase
MQLANPFHRVILGMERAMFAERRYRRVVALTNKVRDDLGRFYGVPSADVDILPNGYSPAEFNLGLRDRFRMQIRKRLGIPADAWVVLFVANEWERKGLQPLMEALCRWRKQAVHLVAAGRLPEKRMKQLELRYGLKGRFHFVGGREPVNTWFGMADAFALPTLYEAWGMVIVEALASGLPVLTSVSAGAAVAVRHTHNGILLQDPASASEILAGLLRLRRCIQTSPEQISASVSEYEWSRLLGRYEEIIWRAI